MVSSRFILTALVIDIKISNHTILCIVGTYKGCKAPMIDLNNYYFKPYDDKGQTNPKWLFLDEYGNDSFEWVNMHNATKILHAISDEKWKVPSQHVQFSLILCYA